MNKSFYKNGLIRSNYFVEMDRISNLNMHTYTPGTGTNQCLSSVVWFYDADAKAGDVSRVIISVRYAGFTTNTNSSFNMFWQGANYTTATSSVWAGTNLVTTALNAQKSLKTLVLSSDAGFYTYNTTFTLTQPFMDEYIGSGIGIRTDYSNGSGTIRINYIMFIPEKYYTDDHGLAVKMGDTHIATGELVEI